MGNSCGCCGSQDTGEEGEMNMKINKKQMEYEFDPVKANYTSNHERNVIKIQAHTRGSLARNKFKQGDFLKEMLVDDAELQYKDELLFEDGTVYRGQVRELQKNQLSGTKSTTQEYTIRYGYGAQIWPDGAKYQGYWKDNVAFGWGKFNHIDGDVYEGEWEDDKADGFGVYIRAGGLSTYKGQWKSDKQQGLGWEKWNDGSEYIGQFSYSKKSGFGAYTWVDNNKYIGSWKENQIDGDLGVYQWHDGRLYCGQWKNSMMEGVGTYIWTDGRFYHGEYSHDKKHGFGVYVWSDGRAYVGEWIEGKQANEKTYVLPNDEVKRGMWEGDKRVGKWMELSEAQIHACRGKVQEAKRNIQYAQEMKIELEKRIDQLKIDIYRMESEMTVNKEQNYKEWIKKTNKNHRLSINISEEEKSEHGEGGRGSIQRYAD